MNSNLEQIISIIEPKIDLFTFNNILGDTIGTGIQRYFEEISELTGIEDIGLSEILVTSLDKTIFSNIKFTTFLIKYCLNETIIDRISELLKIDNSLSNFRKKSEILKKTQNQIKNVIIKVIQLDSDYFSVSNNEKIKVKETITPYSPLPIEEENFRELIPKVFLSLHPYQKRIKDRLVQQIFFNKANEKVLVHMPTGSGKTKTSIEGIIDFIRVKLRNTDDGGIVIWFTHSKELSEQAYDAFKSMWYFKGDYPINIYKVFGDSNINEIENVTSDKVAVLFIGFQKYNSILSSNNSSTNKLKYFLSSNTKLAIVDEAHKSLAKTYKRAIESVTSMPDCRLIGLTATPGRSNYIIGDNENNELSSFFGNSIIRITNEEGELVNNPLGYLQAHNILANIKFETLESTIDFRDKYSQDELYKISNSNDLGDNELNLIATNPHRNNLIISKIQKHVEKGNSILVFATSIDHCTILQNILRLKEIESSVITGTTNKKIRFDSIQNFKSGKLKVIINYGVLSTGFDAPKLNTLIICRPTKSIVLYSQMVGRALRGPKNGGNELNTLITIKDNLIGFPDPDFLFSYWDEFWN